MKDQPAMSHQGERDKMRGQTAPSFPLFNSFSKSSAILCLSAALVGCGPGGEPVQGSVLDPGGNQVQGVMVVFYPGGAGEPIQAPVDPEGHFNLRCPSGEYKVTVTSISGATIAPGPSGRPFMRPTGAFVIPRKYSRLGTTDLVVTIPSSGDQDVKIRLSDR
jgi:hypothetical protein